MLVCHPDHRLAKRRPDPGRPVDETFVDFETTWGVRDIADRALNAAHVKHDVTLEVNNMHTLLDLVWHRLGVALVPAPIAAKKATKLATVPLRPGDADTWQVAVAVPTPGAMSLAAQALLTLLPSKYRPSLPETPSGPNPRRAGLAARLARQPAASGCRRLQAIAGRGC